MKIQFQILIALFILTSHQAFAGSGGESGGGGGVLMRASGPLLIDFLNIDLNFKDQSNFGGREASRISTPLDFSINESNIRQIRNDISAFDLAIGVLEKWKSLKFDIAGMTALIALYEPLQWSFVDKKLSAAVFFPEGVAASEPTAIAGYYLASARQFKIQLSTPIWNEMQILSQTGLVIHEGLRHVQIGFSAHFDEKSLQEATAILMMCKPKARLSYFVHYLMENDPATAKKLYGDFREIIKTDCERTL